MDRIVIAVAGGSCSGKTTFATALANALGAPTLRTDDYYRPLDHLTYDERCGTNFDHPDTIDHDLLGDHVQSLIEGKSIESPLYDFTRHTRFTETRRIEPAAYVVVEGLFVLCYPRMRDLCQVRVFVNAPDDICLYRRIERDVAERGRTATEVVERFQNDVWPMFLEHIEPTRTMATVQVCGLGSTEAGLAEVFATFDLERA